MRLTVVLLALAGILAFAGCSATSGGTRGAEVTQEPARVVNASELDEEGGVTSRPARPEIPADAAGEPHAELPPAGQDGQRQKPSAFEPDEEAAKAQEKEIPLFEPSKKADQVDPSDAESLLREMKAKIESEMAERAKKMEGLAPQVRDASASKEKGEEAKKKFEDAEKLYSQKKHKEAAAAYLAVLELVPMHEEALARLRQCYIDMDKEGKRATVLKKPATRQEMLLLEQKYASAARLYDEGSKDDALAKFKEVVEMIEWSPAKIDTKNILGKARDYIERIKIEKELAAKPAEKKEQEPQEKPPQEKPPQEKPPEKKPPQQPGPGDLAPY